MNSFIFTLACASCLGPFQGTPTNIAEWAEIDCLVEEQWTRSQSRLDIDYRRASDWARISIWTLEIPANDSIERNWKAWTASSIGTPYQYDAPASNIALGDTVKYYQFASGDNLHVRLGTMLIRVFADYRQIGPPNERTVICNDPQGDIERIEGGARHAVARLKAKEFLPGPSVTVNGRVIPSTLRDGSGKVYVGLDGWAHARNIALNKNVRRGTYAFVHGGQNYVGGLGTDQIKVGANWRSMQSMAVRKGDAWYVPLEGIEGTLQ